MLVVVPVPVPVGVVVPVTVPVGMTVPLSVGVPVAVGMSVPVTVPVGSAVGGLIRHKDSLFPMAVLAHHYITAGRQLQLLSCDISPTLFFQPHCR